MGGSGSGRWGHGAKYTEEDCLRLDIRHLCGKGCFRAGVSGSGSLSWTRSGKHVGSMTYTFNPDRLILSFRSQNRDVQQTITISRTACNFGGVRPWFTCPRCNRRVISFYAGQRFVCRHCLGLSYASQQEGYLDRAMRKERKIRVRIGGSENLTEQLPDWKPKGMHEKTYWKLISKIGQASRGRCSIILKMMRRSQP